jgi:hypothetical protein
MRQQLMLLFFLLTLVTTTAWAADLQISSIDQLDERGVQINGEGFGSRCNDCQVIIDYGDLRYRAEVLMWSDRHIRIRVADINRDLKLKLKLIGETAESSWVGLTIKRTRVPPKDFEHAVSTAMDGFQTYDLASSRSVGARGEQSIDVSAEAPLCGEAGLLFDHARIAFRQRRFGDAQIVAMPAAGCSACAPLLVRWYHEPTGRIDYQV